MCWTGVGRSGEAATMIHTAGGTAHDLDHTRPHETVNIRATTGNRRQRLDIVPSRHVVRTPDGMSKNNNVNPDFYKTAGREHTDGPDNGDDRVEQKERFSQTTKETKQGDRNFIPGADPVGVSPDSKKKE